MRSGLLALTAVVSLLFGVAQLAFPKELLSLFNVTLDTNAILFARTLGGSWIGYAIVNWYARDADDRAQRAVLLADFCVAATGLVISLYTALATGASPLVWVWVALFVVFGALQLYLVAVRR